MPNTEIVNILAKDKTVELIVQNVTKCPLTNNTKDLSQDIYLYLLDMDNKMLNKLYNNNEINFYIIGMVKNNVYSSSSKYYRTYKKFDMLSSDINEFINL